MSRFHVAVGATVAAGLVVLYGCAALEQPPTAPPVTVTAQPPEPNSTVPGDPGDTGQTFEPSPAPTEVAPTAEPTPTSRRAEEPVTVREGSISGVRVNASIYPIRRSGQTVSANVMIQTRYPHTTIVLRQELSDGDPEVGSSSLEAVDGLRLVDARNKKLYLPATTGDGVCACAPADDRAITQERVVWVSVVFAAPPVDVTAVDVSVPGFGTVADVPLF